MRGIKQGAGKGDFRVSAAIIFGCAGSILLLLFVLTSDTDAGVTVFIGNTLPVVHKEKNGTITVYSKKGHLTSDDYIRDVVTHPAFQAFGELLLPWEDNTRYYDTHMRDVGRLMPYHSHVNAGIVVNALNRLIDDVNAGKTVFYDFYTDGQKQTDRTKNRTGIFFYRGKPGAPFAIVCPGGGFSYVGSLHEGFPLAWEISKKGLNAFVIRYRTGEQPATEDLATAIGYVSEMHRHCESVLKITRCGAARPERAWSVTSR